MSKANFLFFLAGLFIGAAIPLVVLWADYRSTMRVLREIRENSPAEEKKHDE